MRIKHVSLLRTFSMLCWYIIIQRRSGRHCTSVPHKASPYLPGDSSQNGILAGCPVYVPHPIPDTSYRNLSPKTYTKVTTHLICFFLWCKAISFKSVSYAAMFLTTNAPKVACVLHGFAMNMALYGLNLGCMNCGEVRWALTINNPYLCTINTAMFSSVLNWWTASTMYHFVV